MSPEQFAYWLHGFCELNSNAVPTQAQWKSISAHLDTVFKKVTPPVSDAAKDKAVESDFQKSVREYLERSQRQNQQAQQVQQIQQPYYMNPFQGFPPGTIIC